MRGGASSRAAEGDPVPGAPGNELKRPRGDLLAGAGHADDVGLAPALVAALQRLAHHLHVADALEAVIGAAAGEVENRSHHVRLPRGIDEIRHPELPRQLFPRRVEVDADDLPGAHQARSLDHVEADAAEPEHHHPRAGFDLGAEDHRADPGGHPAADVAHLVEGRLGVDLRHRDLRQHRVVGEGRAAHVVEQRLAVEREPAAAVRHQPLALGGANGLAQVGLGVQAVFALAAFGRVERDHMIAGRHRGHPRADLDHHARALVAEDGGKQPLGIVARQGEGIRVADAAGLDLDEHLARARPLEVDVTDFQGFAGAERDRCLGFHHSAPGCRRSLGRALGKV